MASGLSDPVDHSNTFGGRLRALRKTHRYSTRSLAEALKEHVADYSVSGAAVRGWEAGEWNGPRRRDVVEALDELLDADGELLRLAGYGPHTGFTARLDAVEVELRRQADVLDEILARLPERRDGE